MIEVKGERGKEGEWKWKVFEENVWFCCKWECEGKEKEKIEGSVESEEGFGIVNPIREWQTLNIVSSDLEISNSNVSDTKETTRNEN